MAGKPVLVPLAEALAHRCSRSYYGKESADAAGESRKVEQWSDGVMKDHLAGITVYQFDHF
jgi:hypothetical protein